jgi:5-(carboxyamino)imidazole ribonucleotide synthase
VTTPSGSEARPTAAVLPGGTIGVLGGGQLGRMLAQAARRLGYGVWVWSPDGASPAFAVADRALHAPFDDRGALEAVADGVDVVTVEFENVPASALEALARRVPVRPGPEVLRRTQHRGAEKRFLTGLGLPTAAYREVPDAAVLDEALHAIGTPAVLKTAGFGYDGKGQVRIDSDADRAAALALVEREPCVLERRVLLSTEVSVIVARDPAGRTATYPVFENAHARAVLDVTVVPARVPPEVAARATDLAGRVAEGLDLVGLACVECFVSEAGEVLVNEIAPRPHNSGHVTIEAAETDQFEQQLRAVCGLPLGATTLRSPGAMANLLGDLWQDGEPDWVRALERPGVHLHLYGKREPRVGRKMGHLTVLDPRPDDAERRARAARTALLPRHGAA